VAADAAGQPLQQRAEQRRIFEHLRSDLEQSFIQGRLDLLEGRSPVLASPLIHSPNRFIHQVTPPLLDFNRPHSRFHHSPTITPIL